MTDIIVYSFSNQRVSGSEPAYRAVGIEIGTDLFATMSLKLYRHFRGTSQRMVTTRYGCEEQVVGIDTKGRQFGREERASLFCRHRQRLVHEATGVVFTVRGRQSE